MHCKALDCVMPGNLSPKLLGINKSRAKKAARSRWLNGKLKKKVKMFCASPEEDKGTLNFKRLKEINAKCRF